MANMIVTSFYKYVNLKNPKAFQKKHQAYCNKLAIKGKVLVADEGINGSISGTKTQIAKYKKTILRNKLFKGVMFKDTSSIDHPFKRMIVRVRPEIVTLGKKVNLKSAAKHISPKTLKKWIEKENVVLIDARNDYESRIGKFTKAITPHIETFKDFPKITSKLKKYKNKKIVVYCTGGIRCEKASALMKDQGFTSVHQLKDGILNYINQYPDDHFEGRCFVFDSRLSIPSGTSNEKISACDLCHVPSDSYINCRNVKCDKMFICCSTCKKTLSATCSKTCKSLAGDRK